MPNHFENRNGILNSLREELVGPSPAGMEIDCTVNIEFEDPKEAYKPWRQKGSGDEILQRDSPSKRYGIGVLYPGSTRNEEDLTEIGFIGRDASISEDQNMQESIIANRADKSLDEVKNRAGYGVLEEECDDLDLSLANSYKPCSMAISFLGEFPSGSYLNVEASGGRYVRKTIKIQGQEREWWLRSAVTMSAEFSQSDICTSSFMKVPATRQTDQNTEGLEIKIEVFSRPYGHENTRLLTVCLVNRKETGLSADELCLFQSRFEAKIVTPDGQPHILPYPRTYHKKLDTEEQALALLYQDAETFGVGHGCAADWRVSTVDQAKAETVIAECLPVFEAPSITPDVRKRDGSLLEIPMAQLAGLIDGDAGINALSELVENYEEWVSSKKSELTNIVPEYRPAAERNM